MPEDSKKCPLKVPRRPKVMSCKCLFCLTNTPKPNKTRQRKAANPHLLEAGTRDYSIMKIGACYFHVNRLIV